MFHVQFCFLKARISGENSVSFAILFVFASQNEEKHGVLASFC